MKKISEGIKFYKNRLERRGLSSKFEEGIGFKRKFRLDLIKKKRKLKHRRQGKYHSYAGERVEGIYSNIINLFLIEINPRLLFIRNFATRKYKIMRNWISPAFRQFSTKYTETLKLEKYLTGSRVDIIIRLCYDIFVLGCIKGKVWYVCARMH